MKAEELRLFREKVEADRALLKGYSLKVLRIVARQYLPKPVPDANQAVRRKVWLHYQRFLHTYPKADVVGALLPYMNSNAEKLLEETALWVELHPRKSSGRRWKGQTEYNKRHWAIRKLVRQWMKEHPEAVSKIYNENIPTLSGLS